MRLLRTLAAALARFAGLFALASAAVLALAGLADLGGFASFRRAGALGFYGLGSLLLLGGFFVGNRGPVRQVESGTTPPLPILGTRRLRLATRAEQEEAVSLGAVLVALGLALIAAGIALDDAHELF